MRQMGKLRLREGGTDLGPPSAMKVALRVSQALTNFLVTRCSNWDQESPPTPPPTPHPQGLGRPWQNWGQKGAGRPYYAAFLPSGALQGEGLCLQRVRRLLPGLLPAAGILCGQRDSLCGRLLLP